MPTQPTQPHTLRTQIHQALRAWQDLNITPDNSLSALRLVKQQRQKHESNTPAILRLATNTVLQTTIAELEQIQPVEAKIIRRHFIERLTHQEIANQLGEKYSKDIVKNKQREALNALADVIWNLEEQARQAQRLRLEEGLPAFSHTHIFGVDTHQQHIIEQLSTPNCTYSPFSWNVCKQVTIDISSKCGASRIATLGSDIGFFIIVNVCEIHHAVQCI